MPASESSDLPAFIVGANTSPAGIGISEGG
jgi:hypothetical protein